MPVMLLGGPTYCCVKGVNLKKADELFGMVHRGLTRSNGINWLGKFSDSEIAEQSPKGRTGSPVA